MTVRIERRDDGVLGIPTPEGNSFELSPGQKEVMGHMVGGRLIVDAKVEALTADTSTVSLTCSPGRINVAHAYRLNNSGRLTGRLIGKLARGVEPVSVSVNLQNGGEVNYIGPGYTVSIKQCKLPDLGNFGRVC